MECEYLGILEESLFSILKKDSQVPDMIKERLGIPDSEKYFIGDTVISIGRKTKSREIYSAVWKGRTFYYVIINDYDDNLAFAFSIWPGREHR